ncbi:MAG: DEAD/DEAH box helicase [Candidatus Nealsonbacteria bacterium]|nr:DEAD/DEAH box helicase [Candidatus Nealsonbacteria bacterium]
MEKSTLDRVLIVGITPYFLERENFWFEENLQKILTARKTQSFFEDNIVFLEKGSDFNFSRLLRQLDEMGYEIVQEVAEPGEIARHGGTIDIFPVNLNRAVRINYFGNKIEEIEQSNTCVSDEKKDKERLKKKLKNQKIYSQLQGLKPGDFLVHLDHGIGLLTGITGSPASAGSRTSSFPFPQKYYVLEYASGDKLYVPLGLERKLSRYVGFINPKISRLSAPTWLNTKRKVKEETEKLAAELLEIYAQREVARRQPYSRDFEMEAKIQETFAYLETPDQAQATNDIAKDLEESEMPMDRIVCGDVGFGKTEIALRAVIKAVSNGKQAAMICPTTILASQHYQNFTHRLNNLPVKIALISRLQSKSEQKTIAGQLKAGEIDIAIGTHRLLSADIAFKNLGMLVIDDEQKFGVEQKERLKRIRPQLDILSLSATPIPRTLYFALSSLKNISIVKTPPPERLPVETFIKPRSEKIIRRAIEAEITRGGQVYYLHNRVATIEMVKKSLAEKFPHLNVGVVHGRMNEPEMVSVMRDFKEKNIDVLVATTIIENGIDLSNANTLVVADAAKLGLAQAHQIRGRVGRSNVRAFAYFLHSGKLNDLAKRRLQALKEAQNLGSGYKVALQDMEIRGAGNILGKEQSGSVNQVGLNLYCQMLSEVIEKLKTAKPAP